MIYTRTWNPCRLHRRRDRADTLRPLGALRGGGDTGGGSLSDTKGGVLCGGRRAIRWRGRCGSDQSGSQPRLPHGAAAHAIFSHHRPQELGTLPCRV